MLTASAPVRFIQITDLHLKTQPSHLWGADVDAGLTGVLAHLQAHHPSPDFILITGDLVGDEPAAYHRVRAMLEPLNVPVYCLPGNHDFPAMMGQVLQKGWVQRERYFTVSNWQLVLLDSSFPNTPDGHLATSELLLLDTALASEPDRYTVVCLHHNPLAVGTGWLDTMKVINGEQLFTVLARYPHVRAVVWGHIHSEFTGQRGPIQLFAAPATSVQFRPDAAEPQVDTKNPGYRWFTLYDDGTLDSGVERIAASNRADSPTP